MSESREIEWSVRESRLDLIQRASRKPVVSVDVSLLVGDQDDYISMLKSVIIAQQEALKEIDFQIDVIRGAA